MKNQAQLLQVQQKLGRNPSDQSIAGAPRRRISRMEQFNESFNRKLRSVFSTVDWGQVNHYMDRLT